MKPTTHTYKIFKKWNDGDVPEKLESYLNSPDIKSKQLVAIVESDNLLVVCLED